MAYLVYNTRVLVCVSSIKIFCNSVKVHTCYGPLHIHFRVIVMLIVEDPTVTVNCRTAINALFLYLRDRPFFLKGGGVMVFCSDQNFFFGHKKS